MSAQQQVKRFLGLHCIVTITIIITNYIVDPFHLFYKNIWAKHTYNLNAPFFNLGLIETFLKKSDDYDSILIGTSHTQNFIASEITQVLNTKGTLKLYLFGGQPVEFEAIAKKALSSNKVKKILWGLETIFFRKPAYTPHSKRTFPYDWYRTAWGKYTLLMHPTVIKETIWSLV